MKKKFYTILAATFAVTLIVASPAASITSHAFGFNSDGPGDDTDYGRRPHYDWDDYDNPQDWMDSQSNQSSESNQPSPAPSEPAPAPTPDPAPAPAEPSPAPSESAPAPAPSDSQPAQSEPSNSEPEQAPSVEATPAPAPAVESVPAAEKKDSGTVKKDSKKSDNTAKDSDSKDNSKETETVSDKDGNLVYGKFTYVISKDRVLCSVYYDGKYMACFTMTDSKGNNVLIESITLEEDRNGYCNMDITVSENTKTAKVTIINAGSKGTYSMVKTIGVKTICVNGLKVPLAIKKLPSASATEYIK